MMNEQQTGFYAVRLIEERRSDGSSTWVADHPDLPGCNAVGLTQEEAQENLEKSREVWLGWAEKHDVNVKPPREDPCVLIQYAIRRDAARAKETDSDIGSHETVDVAVPA